MPQEWRHFGFPSARAAGAPRLTLETLLAFWASGPGQHPRVSWMLRSVAYVGSDETQGLLGWCPTLLPLHLSRNQVSKCSLSRVLLTCRYLLWKISRCLWCDLVARGSIRPYLSTFDEGCGSRHQWTRGTGPVNGIDDVTVCGCGTFGGPPTSTSWTKDIWQGPLSYAMTVVSLIMAASMTCLYVFSFGKENFDSLYLERMV